MAHNATEIDIKTSNELAVRALQNLQHETEINTSSLIQAIENTEDDSIKKLAEDIFVGSPINHKRIFELYNQELQGIGHTEYKHIYNRHSRREEKEKRSKETSQFLQVLDSIRQTQLVIDDLIKTVNEAMSSLETHIASIETQRTAVGAKIELMNYALDAEEKSNELHAAEANLTTLQEDIKKAHKLYGDTSESRHEQMKGRFSMFGIDDSENIWLVSMDKDRIVQFNGHEVSYDNETHKLFYTIQDPQTGEMVEKEVPPSQVARLWNEAEEKNLIFANEKTSFFSWVIGSNNFSTSLKISDIFDTFKNAEQDQMALIEGLRNELEQTQQQINNTVAKSTNLNAELVELKQQILREFNSNNGSEYPEHLRAKREELLKEYTALTEELESAHQELNDLVKWKSLLQNPDTARKLYTAINNDDSKTVTYQELQNLTAGLPASSKASIIETLEKHGITVETTNNKGQTESKSPQQQQFLSAVDGQELPLTEEQEQAPASTWQRLFSTATNNTIFSLQRTPDNAETEQNAESTINADMP